MGLQAVQLITTGVNYAFDLFTTMLDRTGLTSFYFAMLAILLIVSFLLGGFLVPVSGSDSVGNGRKSGGRRANRYGTAKYGSGKNSSRSEGNS